MSSQLFTLGVLELILISPLVFPITLKCLRSQKNASNHCSIQHDILTRCIISLFDLLAAKCNPLSPPSFTAVTLAPRNKSKSNTAVCPSLEAHRSGVKPWSSLEKRTIELSMKGHENARDLSQTRPHHDVQVNSINIKSCCFTKLYGTACKVSGVWMHENIRSVNCCVNSCVKCLK